MTSDDPAAQLSIVNQTWAVFFKLPLCIGVLLRQDDIKGYADGVTALIITDNSSCPFFKLCHSETSLITLIEIKSFNEMGEHAIGRLLPSSTR